MKIPAAPALRRQTGDGTAGDALHCVPVDATPPSGHPLLRFVLVLALAGIGLFAVPAAQADDLIQLNGDLPVTLAGNYSFGLLYLDGNVRLSGDTSITATDVFIGPDAQLQTCFDRERDGNNCTNGRSLTFNASGGVAISPAIDLRGLVGANRPGGALAIHAARVALGGAVETAGTARQLGRDRDRLPRPRRHAGPARARRRHLGARRGRRLDRRRRLERGSDTATPTVANERRPVDLASSGGDVSVLGSIASPGRDVAGAGAIVGGNGGSGHGRRRRRSHLRRHRLAPRVAASTSRRAKPVAISLAARGALVVSGAVNASGDASTGGNGSDGAAIAHDGRGLAGARLGQLDRRREPESRCGRGRHSHARRGRGSQRRRDQHEPALVARRAGRHGGAVSVSGASVALGTITSDAGDATSDPSNGSGEIGGAVTVKATGNAGVGAISARGGSGRALGGGGAGGTVAITGDRVTTGSITALGENLSAPGGSVTLAAQTALLVGGAVDTSGGAGASGNPGGAGGSMVLEYARPAHARRPPALRRRKRGLRQLPRAPVGQRRPDRARRAVDRLVDRRAQRRRQRRQLGRPERPSGQRRRWRPRARVGAGAVADPAPAGRLRRAARAPRTAPTDRRWTSPRRPVSRSSRRHSTLAFTTHSPDAEGYRVFASVAGAPAKAMLTTKTASAVLPKVAPCVAVAYSLTRVPYGRRLAERPHRAGQRHEPAVGDAGLHGRASGHARRAEAEEEARRR